MMLSRSRIGYVALLLSVAAAGCDRVALLAPTSSTISISADARTLPTGGSTLVTAVVAEAGGNPVQNGTAVRFTTSLGRVDPAEVETRGGIAVTTFFAGDTSGTADVRATSGGATGTGSTATGGPAATTTGSVVTILVGSAAATALTLSASSSTVPSAGGTVTVTAAVFDASGNRMRGVQVSFTTTAGNLSFSAVSTNENGQASVDLTTSRTATVTARVGAGGTGTATDARTATLIINVATANNLSLTVSPSPAVVGQPVTLTVSPTVGANNSAPRVTVTWGDGTQSDLGTVAASRTASHSYTRTGTFTITATGTAEGETTSASISVTVAAPTPNGIAVAVLPATAPVGQPVTATVTVTVGANNTAPRVMVAWGDGTTSDLGTVGAGARTVPHVYTSAGIFTITATGTTDTETTSSSAAVTVTPQAAIGVTIGVSGTQTTCSSITFTATVTGEVAANIRSYEWRIDGNTVATTTGASLTRVFSSTGTRVIDVIVTTTDGRTGNGQTQINIAGGSGSCNNAR